MWNPFARTKPRRNGRRRVLRRNYDAAKADRLTYNWAQTSVSINDALISDLHTLIARSREQRRNNDWCRAFIRQVSRNVVGPYGVISQARTLNTDGGPDVTANENIEAAWKDWGNTKECDIAGKLTWPAMQRLWIESVANEGGAVVLKHRSGRYGMQLQLIDNLLLDVEYNVDRSGLRIVMGVEVDWALRPEAYHFIDTKGASGYGAWRHLRIPADQALYSFVTEEIGQVRGIPWTATALPRLHMLDGYEDSALVAARMGAAKGGHYITEEGSEEFTGDDVDEEGNVVEEIEPGIARQLPRGVKFEAYDPTYPHQQYAAFTKSQLRAIASSLGVSYNGLANDLEGVNYSSMRSGKLEEWDIWRTLQDWMIGELVTPVYQQWLESSLALGLISVAGKQLPLSRVEKFSRVDHQGRRWPWVDPKNEILADAKAIELRLSSRSRVIRERYGLDPRDVFREIEAEELLLKEAGILVGAGTATEGQQNGTEPAEPAVAPGADDSGADT